VFAYDSFRAARWIRTINLVLQAVLFLTLFGGLNYLARNHAWRFDLTRQRKFSLSPETLSYIKNLPRPVRIVVSYSGDEVTPEVSGLLNEYAHVTEDLPNSRITCEFVDLYQNRRRAEQLGIDQADIITFLSGDTRRSQPLDALYVIKDKQRQKFQGEQAVTAALLEVSSPVRQKIYFVAGHGELQLADNDGNRGLSTLRDELRGRGFEVDTVNLTVTRGVPPDCSLLVIANPSLQSSFTPQEQEFLRRYLVTRAGRVILLLAPGRAADRFGLADLCFDWGILVDDDLVLDPAPENMTEDGDLFLWAFPEHPITQMLHAYKFPLRLGPSRTVRVDPGQSPASGLTVIPLAATSEKAWGETNYRTQPFARDNADVKPMRGIPPEKSLSVIVASERVSVRDNLPFSVPGGRLVVFGSGDFIANSRIGNFGNLPVFLGAVNWSVDRDRQLNVPPRPIERFQLAISAAEFTRLRYALLLALPGGALLLGLLVYWTRRA
jgi:hypothetical protein